MIASPRQLEYLIALSETLSFREAARRSHVSQPGLSAQIAQLEENLGVSLFERDRRRVMITPAGREMTRRARPILAALDEMQQAAAELADPFSGSLRLGVIPTVAPYLVPRALPPLRRILPGLKTLLREDQTGSLVQRTTEGSVDLLLLALEADLGDLQTTPIFRDPFVAAIPKGHRLSGRKRLTEADLADEEVLLLEDGHCLRDQAWSVCRGAGAQELSEFRGTSLVTLTEMVAGGLGVTLLPEMAAKSARRTPGLQIIPFSKGGPFRTIGLAWRRTDPRGALFAKIEEILLNAVAPVA